MIQSIVNFRDFGGRPSRFGGEVWRDRLYRSGAIATVEEAEKARLLDLDFALVADLRYAKERLDEPSPWRWNSPRASSRTMAAWRRKRPTWPRSETDR